MKTALKHWYLGGGYDGDYQAVLNRAATLGYTQPSASQKTLQNQLVLDLKSIGAWDELDVFYVHANDGSKEFATLNWKNPSAFQFTLVNSPSWTSNQGFAGNGSTSYIKNGYIPLTSKINLSLNDASHIGYIYTNAAIDGAATYGCFNSANYFSLNPRTTGDLYAFSMFQATAVTSTPGGITNSIGFYHSYRTASNSIRGYKNGSLLQSGTNASTSLTSSEFYACGWNNNGTPALLDTRTLSILGIGSAMDGLETDLNTSIQNYITAL